MAAPYQYRDMSIAAIDYWASQMELSAGRHFYTAYTPLMSARSEHELCYWIEQCRLCG